MGFISLVNDIQFMLISSHHISIIIIIIITKTTTTTTTTTRRPPGFRRFLSRSLIRTWYQTTHRKATANLVLLVRLLLVSTFNDLQSFFLGACDPLLLPRRRPSGLRMFHQKMRGSHLVVCGRCWFLPLTCICHFVEIICLSSRFGGPFLPSWWQTAHFNCCGKIIT